MRIGHCSYCRSSYLLWKGEHSCPEVELCEAITSVRLTLEHQTKLLASMAAGNRDWLKRMTDAMRGGDS